MLQFNQKIGSLKRAFEEAYNENITSSPSGRYTSDLGASRFKRSDPAEYYPGDRAARRAILQLLYGPCSQIDAVPSYPDLARSRRCIRPCTRHAALRHDPAGRSGSTLPRPACRCAERRQYLRDRHFSRRRNRYNIPKLSCCASPYTEKKPSLPHPALKASFS